LGTSFGRGGATTYQEDLRNADSILIMGSNMAENHPVGFQWVMEARLRGAKVMHVDPRYSRTSAMSDLYVPIRAGTDIAFLGGVVRYIIENERWFDEYVKNFTNAPVIIDDRFRDTEDLDGLFSGFDEARQIYDTGTWHYAGMPEQEAAGERSKGGTKGEQSGHGAQSGGLRGGEPPEEDLTMQHERCVFQILKRHFNRYTPELVSEICGCTVDQFLEVAETLCANSGRERTGAIVYSVGWTQHSVGVQYIRSAAIVQQLLGNIGRPGGGIMALRGHASIQGSTDMATLYNILPGYMPMPHGEEVSSLQEYLKSHGGTTGRWAAMPTFLISQLRAFYGANATKENDFCFDLLPRINGDHGTYQSALDMLEGKVRGFFLFGENPAVGSANSKLQRLALASLDWLVVRDFVEIESASFWHDAPELETGELKTEEIATEVFFLPAATHVEKDGSFTNTQRLLQWHWKALDPPEDCRSDLGFTYHLGLKIREKLKDSTDPIDRGILALDWAYATAGEHEEPSAAQVLREINGVGADGKALSKYQELADDGSTSCGCWIYCGSFKEEQNQTARKKPHWEQGQVPSEWGWSWPANERILYNRASADREGKPWSERKKYIWWDAEKKQWTGLDTPDFTPDKPPDYRPPDGARGDAAVRGDHPFVLQSDGRSWLFASVGLMDGPLPTHYEPHESPFDNPLYSQRANPCRQLHAHDLNRYNPAQDDAYPYVVTTYRLTEHHTAGGMSRTLAYLSELQPELFIEVSPELAAERRLEHGGWATVITARTAIEARVLVTERMKPLEVQGRKLLQVGVPYHWGTRGLTTGDAGNDLYPIALDPNVHIQEVKAATCDVRPGRRPRGPKLLELVASYPSYERESGIAPR
jgi:formate dehydrogenase major subunit